MATTPLGADRTPPTGRLTVTTPLTRAFIPETPPQTAADREPSRPLRGSGLPDRATNGRRCRGSPRHWRDPAAFVFDRKADAERWLDNVRGDLVRGTYVDPGAGRELFHEVAERWLSIQVHRPTTAAQVRSNFDAHVLPAFGDRPIGTIRPIEVQAWVRDLTSRLAPGTVEVIYRYQAAVFRAAVEDRVIAVSPCPGGQASED